MVKSLILVSHGHFCEELKGSEILGVPYETQRIITAHIGNGGSITAVKNGKSINTSMGMT